MEMERSLRLLLVAGLLAALLPAAAATFGPQPEPLCEPTSLATQVALFCAPDKPTAQCCEHVVAAVDLGGIAGVPCLCRVAASPQLVMAGLNSTDLLTLYNSCGQRRPGGAHLNDACEAPPAAVGRSPQSSSADDASPLSSSSERQAPAVSFGRKAAGVKLDAREDDGPCDVRVLSQEINSTCSTPDSPIPKCCEAVVASFAMDCVCSVADRTTLSVIGYNAYKLADIYRKCSIHHLDESIPSACYKGPATKESPKAPAAVDEDQDELVLSHSDGVIFMLMEVIGIINAIGGLLLSLVKGYLAIKKALA